MQLFRPEDPKLDEFVRSNKHFSLESVQGINGQRRPLSKDFVEALEDARVIEISNYIKSFEIKDGELASILSDENKSIDSIQKGWLRKSLSEAIELNELDDALKQHLQIGLVAKKTNTDLCKGIFDVEENLNDPIARRVFNIKSGSIHHQAVSTIIHELNLIAKEPEDVDGREYNPRNDRISALTKLTGANDLQEIFEVMTYVCDIEILEEGKEQGLEFDNSIHGFASKQIELLNQALMSHPEIKNAIDTRDFTSDLAIAYEKGDKSFNYPKLAKGSMESAETILGSLKSNEQMNLNFQNNIDYAAEAKRLIQSMGVSIDTEHSRFGIGNKFQENITGKKFIEIDVQRKNNNSIFDKMANLFTQKGKPNQKINTDKIDWSESDYSWHQKDKHFDTENDKPVKKVSFKDKEGKPMFIHKASGAFSNNGGVILFAKGREINSNEAKLMVAQFMRTCRTGSMFITPPKHLDSPEKTSNHVRMIMEAAVELGLSLDSIHVRPNNMVKAEEIERMKAEIAIRCEAQSLNDYGGISDAAHLIDDANEMEHVITVENRVENDAAEIVGEPAPTSNTPAPESNSTPKSYKAGDYLKSLGGCKRRGRMGKM